MTDHTLPDGRLVALVGAGISAVAPSDVPSWWHFNTTVLGRIVALASRDLTFNADTVAALDALSLDDIGVALFSQVAADCIAGERWFSLLLHLDGSLPGQCHDALAQLAAEGRLAAIVTTNFDTLIEKAFTDAGVPLDLHVPGAGPLSPLDEAGPCRLVKVHGSATDAQSLVDLASQKLRGLPVTTRRWLGEAFAEHPVLVVGFSGSDLELGDDYLGLHAAAAHMPWLRWVTRGGRPPLRAAAAVVAANRDGAFVEGDLPDVLAAVGLAIPPVRTAPAGPAEPPSVWVDGWLADIVASPLVAAAMAARLLDIARCPEAATAVRATIREAIVTAMRDGVSIVDALQFSAALALIGNDEVAGDPERAIEDLDLARRIVSEVITPEIWAKLSERSRIEQDLNAASVLENLAAARLKLGAPNEAAALLAEAKDHVDALPPDVGRDRRAGAWVLSGAIQHQHDDLRSALIAFRIGGAIARQTGNASLQVAALEGRKQIAALLGEVDLARLLQAELEPLRAYVPGITGGVVDLDAVEWSSPQREAVFETLLKRLRTEVRLGGERLDEVLYSLWCVVDSVPAHVDTLREALGELNPQQVVGLRHEAHALLKVARHTLAEEDDTSLLDDVPHALSAWAAELFGPAGLTQGADGGMVLHPSLGEAIAILGRRWAQTGISRQSTQQWEEANRQFIVGGSALLLAGAHDEAIRAMLYSTDALFRMGEHVQAATQLAYLAREAGPALTSSVLTRQLRTLAGAMDAKALTPADGLVQATPILRRLERLGDAETLGVGTLTVANFHYYASDYDAALTMARHAEALIQTPAYKEQARQAVAQMEASRAAASSSPE